MSNVLTSSNLESETKRETAPIGKRKALRRASKACTTRSPNHLYKRGNILYFRFVFTTEQQKRMETTEIRVSLKTGFLQEARRLAQFLRVYLNELLMDETLHFPDIKAKITEAVQKKTGYKPSWCYRGISVFARNCQNH